MFWGTKREVLEFWTSVGSGLCGVRRSSRGPCVADEPRFWPTTGRNDGHAASIFLQALQFFESRDAKFDLNTVAPSLILTFLLLRALKIIMQEARITLTLKMTRPPLRRMRQQHSFESHSRL